MSFESFVFDDAFDDGDYTGRGEVIITGGRVGDDLVTFSDIMTDFLEDDSDDVSDLPLAAKTGTAVKKVPKAELFKNKPPAGSSNLASKVKKKSLVDSVKNSKEKPLGRRIGRSAAEPLEGDEPSVFDLEPLSQRVREIPPEGPARAQEEDQGDAFGDIGSQADDSAPITDLGMFTAFVQVV